jgi:hypothetical protein
MVVFDGDLLTDYLDVSHSMVMFYGDLLTLFRCFPFYGYV